MFPVLFSCLPLHFFFFCEFKDPQVVYDRLKVKRDQIDGRTQGVEENKAVVTMIDKIVEDINPIWLNERRKKSLDKNAKTDF